MSHMAIFCTIVRNGLARCFGRLNQDWPGGECMPRHRADYREDWHPCAVTASDLLLLCSDAVRQRYLSMLSGRSKSQLADGSRQGFTSPENMKIGTQQQQRAAVHIADVRLVEMQNLQRRTHTIKRHLERRRIAGARQVEQSIIVAEDILHRPSV